MDKKRKEFGLLFKLESIKLCALSVIAGGDMQQPVLHRFSNYARNISLQRWQWWLDLLDSKLLTFSRNTHNNKKIIIFFNSKENFMSYLNRKTVCLFFENVKSYLTFKLSSLFKQQQKIEKEAIKINNLFLLQQQQRLYL